MDDSLLKYDESLEALEKQREDLELVMKRMGAEWAESGAGIGWLGDTLYKQDSNPSNQSLPISETSRSIAPLHPPLMSLVHGASSTISEPSHDYLQTLLNVNDELLAESLASTAEPSNHGHYYYANNGSFHPQLSKPSPFISQARHLPLSPANDPADSITADTPQITHSVTGIAQFTPPITPE